MPSATTHSVQVNALVYVGDSKSREVIRTYEFNATRRQGTMRQHKFEVMHLRAGLNVAGQSSQPTACCSSWRPVMYVCGTSAYPRCWHSPWAALVQVVITTYELILKDAAILNQVGAAAHHTSLAPPFPSPAVCCNLLHCLARAPSCWKCTLQAGLACCTASWRPSFAKIRALLGHVYAWLPPAVCSHHLPCCPVSWGLAERHAPVGSTQHGFQMSTRARLATGCRSTGTT